MSDRRANPDRTGGDRRASSDLPRLIDREAAVEAARQALMVGAALATERIRVHAEWELAKQAGRISD